MLPKQNNNNKNSKRVGKGVRVKSQANIWHQTKSNERQLSSTPWRILENILPQNSLDQRQRSWMVSYTSAPGILLLELSPRRWKSQVFLALLTGVGCWKWKHSMETVETKSKHVEHRHQLPWRPKPIEIFCSCWRLLSFKTEILDFWLKKIIYFPLPPYLDLEFKSEFN